jgi:hypothetical protein
VTGLLYRWPQSAKFDRVVPKSKFYEHGHVSTAVREKFVDEVQRITWYYKLAESTIHLPASVVVPEIQVFRIEAKHADVSDAVLVVIDKAVKTPIIFEITHDDAGARRTRTVAAHKEIGTSTLKLGDYFTSGWCSADSERIPLPTSIDLASLYAALLEPLLPLPVRPGEEMSEVTARLEKARKLEREVAALERKIRNEPQFNRKVELRRELRTKQAMLAEVANAASSTTGMKD